MDSDFPRFEPQLLSLNLFLVYKVGIIILHRILTSTELDNAGKTLSYVLGI